MQPRTEIEMANFLLLVMVVGGVGGWVDTVSAVLGNSVERENSAWAKHQTSIYFILLKEDKDCSIVLL